MRHGITRTTVAKWRKRTCAADLQKGPKNARSTVLTIGWEAMLLPPDDCIYALQPTIPRLT